MTRSLAVTLVAVALLGCSEVIDASSATYASAAPGPRMTSQTSVEMLLQPQEVEAADLFGAAIALSDGELIVTSGGADLTEVLSTRDANCGETIDAKAAGKVYAFEHGQAGWIPSERRIARRQANDDEGVFTVLGVPDLRVMPIALREDTLALGVPGMDYTGCVAGADLAAPIPNAGAVFLFGRDADGSWQQTALLTSSRPAPDGLFGASIALHDGRLFAGAPGEDVSPLETGAPIRKAGAVYAFSQPLPEGDSQWTEAARLEPNNPAFNALFGIALAADGDTLAIGAVFDPHEQRGINPAPSGTGAATESGFGSLSGAAYVFRERDARWIQEAFIKADNADANDSFGSSVALEGDTLVVGALLEAAGQPRPFADSAELAATMDNEMLGAGAVYAYRRSGDTWRLHAYIKAPQPEIGAAFGSAVAIDGGRLLVGAPTEGIGPDGKYNTDDTGAAYLYDRIEPGVMPRALRPSGHHPNAIIGFAVALHAGWAALGGPSDENDRGRVLLFEIP